MTKTWTPIVTEAARIAGSYSTAVTLRQLHYRLVAAAIGGYENTEQCYKRLSALTAAARRDGWFPGLADTTRGVDVETSWDSPAEAMDALIDQYRRDRTEGQKFQTWVFFEKATLTAQMDAWTQEFGIPHAALRGYSSESLESEVFVRITGDGRPVVGFYVGDLDPEGEDIERNFRRQAIDAGITFEVWERLAVMPSQIAPLGLVRRPGKVKSSRAAGFTARHGSLFQIEVEAIDPAVLETLVMDALQRDDVFDVDAFDDIKAAEAADIDALQDVRDSLL